MGFAVGVRGVTQTASSFLGGPLVDRWDRRKLLLANNGITAAVVLALALLYQTGAIQLWHVLAGVFIGGAVGGLNAPAFNALTYDVIGSQRLLNAAAFRFMAQGMMGMLSSLVGGYTIGLLGIGASYLLSGIAYLAGAATLLKVKAPRRPAQAREDPFRALAAGLAYAFRTPPVRSLLLLSLVTEFFGFSYQHMKPYIARDVLDVGAVGLGYLQAAGALGQMVAMLGVAALGDFRWKGWLVLGGALAFGSGIILFGLSPWFALSLMLAAIVGGAGAVYDSTMSTVTQMMASPEMRGRILGLYVATWGSNPVGGFALGALVSFVGIPLALALTGSIVMINAVRLVPSVKNLSPAVSPPGQQSPQAT